MMRLSTIVTASYLANEEWSFGPTRTDAAQTANERGDDPTMLRSGDDSDGKAPSFCNVQLCLQMINESRLRLDQGIFSKHLILCALIGRKIDLFFPCFERASKGEIQGSQGSFRRSRALELVGRHRYLGVRRRQNLYGAFLVQRGRHSSSTNRLEGEGSGDANFAIDACLFPFWQWRHALKSQSVGHKRTLSPQGGPG